MPAPSVMSRRIRLKKKKREGEGERESMGPFQLPGEALACTLHVLRSAFMRLGVGLCSPLTSQRIRSPASR